MKTTLGIATALLLTVGSAFAQTDSGSDSSNAGSGSSNAQQGGGASTGGATDASNYLTGPNIHRFYTDDTMDTLRPEAEMRSTWQGMSADDQAKLKQACSGNKDSRWSALCNSLSTM